MLKESQDFRIWWVFRQKIYIYFLCEIKNGKEIRGQEVKEIKWVKANEVENLIKEKLPGKLKEYLNSIA